MTAPPTGHAATLPPGFRLRMTARRHGAGLLESTQRPAVARVPSQGSLPDGEVLVVDGPRTAAVAVRLMDLGLAVSDPGPAAAGLPGLEALTVVVPVRDRPAGLDRLLTGLSVTAAPDRSAGGPRPSRRPRVLVVDDASSDPAPIREVARRHGARLLELPVQHGPAGARNAGLRAVRTPFVAFVDSDVTVQAVTLERLLAEFADPVLAVAAPRIMRGETEGRPGPLSWYEGHVAPLDLGRRAGLVGPGRPLTYVPSACWVCRTEALGRGFDGRLRVGEDVDLVWRLAGSGWRVRYVPGLRAGHGTREDVWRWWRQHAGYGYSSAALARRHPGLLAPARYTATGLAVAAALAAPWPVLLATVFLAAAQAERRLRLALPGAADPASGGTAGAPVPLPGLAGTARRLARAGLVANLGQTAQLATRYWLPVLLLAAPRFPAARRLLVRGLVVDAALAVHRRAGRGAGLRAGLTALAALPLRAAEDAAFAAGVLGGCLVYRTSAPLRPQWAGGGRARRG
ncbi:glycosyltransferase [Citricoccus sp. SGAir0253]|uniref:glycosyltransferase n=1 Tax=Citricoccus sp. SGAir0253 TaxID=2567881 RepID=UPI0010CD0D5E|nr:glycosyltransferase [Citricoccus sp. SGAir0253]QCU78900.1 glycosyltransferase [Citricoccus sp. SGAir0253]